MAIFFISDTHWHHRNILEYDQRPFSSIEERDQTLIDNWNAIVKETDEIFHLGDVGFGVTVEFLARLNGKKYLIRGNHDRYIKKSVLRLAFAWVEKCYFFDREGVALLLSHWPDEGIKDRWNIHGHQHGKGCPQKYRLDLSCNLWGYRPLSLQDLQTHIANWP
jgi:calcineurin-like phosphoesterase family protein